ncbi:hypothetical protein GA0070621_0239 [Micromonospora narathiwatensis]|uniref:Uncharacterized protein n=1 Tax=Micromonospora narathiwatensis TaxID=299146 RepID=A0A1A8Z271_9ACTN|nr:hypothetical protein GA0070621_0239 [Micromonospora narathiwatensis]
MLPPDTAPDVIDRPLPRSDVTPSAADRAEEMQRRRRSGA